MTGGEVEENTTAAYAVTGQPADPPSGCDLPDRVVGRHGGEGGAQSPSGEQGRPRGAGGEPQRREGGARAVAH